MCGSPFVFIKEERVLGRTKMKEQSLLVVALKGRMVFSTRTPLAAFLYVTPVGPEAGC